MKTTPEDYTRSHQYHQENKPPTVTYGLCTTKMEVLAWRNQSLDSDANQILEEMQAIANEREELEKKIEALENKMTAKRMDIKPIRESWLVNFEEYARWRKARNDL